VGFGGNGKTRTAMHRADRVQKKRGNKLEQRRIAQPISLRKRWSVKNKRRKNAV
jgi:hypothetical protein